MSTILAGTVVTYSELGLSSAVIPLLCGKRWLRMGATAKPLESSQLTAHCIFLT